MEKNLAGLCLCCNVFWKVELVRNEIGYLTEEISKENVKGVACFHLTTYSKMQEERNDLKMQLLSKKKSEFNDLEISACLYYK